jgi:hypothetical protein
MCACLLQPSVLQLGWPPSTASALLSAAPLTLRQGDAGGRAAGQSFIQFSQRMEAQLKAEAEEYARQGEELTALRQAAAAHASRTIPSNVAALQHRVHEIQRAADEEKKMAAQAEAAKNQHIKKRLKVREGHKEQAAKWMDGNSELISV